MHCDAHYDPTDDAPRRFIPPLRCHRLSLIPCHAAVIYDCAARRTLLWPVLCDGGIVALYCVMALCDGGIVFIVLWPVLCDGGMCDGM